MNWVKIKNLFQTTGKSSVRKDYVFTAQLIFINLRKLTFLMATGLH